MTIELSHSRRPLADAREAFMAKSAQHIPGKVVLTP